MGEHIRSLLLDPALHVVARTETLLMLAARAQHVDAVITPALESGRDVVCDRFSGSTLAYQGYGRGLAVADLTRLSDWAASGLTPDVVILLTVAPSVSLARREARAPGDRIEASSSSFFERVNAGFAALAAADPARWRVVDGSGTVEEVAALVRQAV